jgi:hypothetical protein
MNQSHPQTSILIISSSSSIAQSLINELTQNPNNRLLLHVRPQSNFSHQESGNIVHLSQLDLLNPEYTLNDTVCYNNAAYEAWFEYVMSEYNPQIMLIATGVIKEPSFSNLLYINAAIPAKCSEMFIKTYNERNNASGAVPLIVFMNSVSADYAPICIGKYYAQSKELMSHILWSIYLQGKSDESTRCAVINAKIGPVDTSLLNDGPLKYMPYIVKKVVNMLTVSTETAAKGLAHYIHLQTTRSYKTVYVPFWWRWINCFAWALFYVINGFLRLIDMVIMMGSWR